VRNTGSAVMISVFISIGPYTKDSNIPLCIMAIILQGSMSG